MAHSHSGVDHQSIDYSINIQSHPDVVKNKDLLIKTRRYLHSTPELSFEEHETAKYVSRYNIIYISVY